MIIIDRLHLGCLFPPRFHVSFSLSLLFLLLSEVGLFIIDFYISIEFVLFFPLTDRHF